MLARLAGGAGPLVGRRPWLVAIGCTVLMGGLAAGIRGYQASYDLNASLPGGMQSMRAYDDLQSGFPPGALSPTNVYLQRRDGQRLKPAAVQGFAAQLRDIPGVSSVMPPRLSPDGTVAEVDLVLSQNPSANGALDTVTGAVRPAVDGAAPPWTEP